MIMLPLQMTRGPSLLVLAHFLPTGVAVLLVILINNQYQRNYRAISLCCCRGEDYLYL